MNEIDEDYFDNINSDIKAYILGTIIFNINNKNFIDFYYKHYIAYNSKLHEGFLKVCKIEDDTEHNPDENSLDENINNEHNHINIEVTSNKIMEQINKYSNIIEFIDNHDRDIVLEYIKAFYEKRVKIYNECDEIKCHLYHIDINVLQKIGDFISIPYDIKTHNLVYTGSNVLDLHGIIYKNKNIMLNYDIYNKFKTLAKIEEPIIDFIKIDERAIIPTRANFTDAGTDLSIIGIIKTFNKKVKLYRTGIKLNIPIGYYVEIVPRSSISKSGYMLANSIGIIDMTYQGELFVALAKIDDEANDIVFPFNCCQLIIKKQLYPILNEVSSFDIKTKRNEGGFGSTST